MNPMFDLAIVGAGPAGLAAATRARALGLTAIVLDEQPAPGGQVWRALEARSAHPRANLPREPAAEALIASFRASGAVHRPGTRVWQIEPGFTLFASAAGASERIAARAVLLATGAQERPVPFPGWTLPGVMTVGAAQILLKTSAQIPDDPVVIAGCGPLVLLYACQLLDAGGRIAAILDTAPAANRAAARAALPRALGNLPELMRGLGWLRRLRRARVRVERCVSALRASGGEALETISFRTRTGGEETLPARVLLVHEGVVPSIHASLALGCDHVWSARQLCFVPRLDERGQSSVAGVFIAGDGGGIGGATAARISGELAALGIAESLGHKAASGLRTEERRLRRQLARALATRPLLDALYRPRAEVATPADETIVCRCEEVTARQVRDAARLAAAGINQVKAFTRCGMGPCQGRACGATVAALIAEQTGRPIADIGFYRIRPPFKPVTLGELAALEGEDVPTIL